MGKKTKEKLKVIALNEDKINSSFKVHNLNTKKVSYKRGMSYSEFMEVNQNSYVKIVLKNLIDEVKLNKLDTWKLKLKSETKAIEDLINHSFCSYKYPSFFKCIFFKSIFEEAMFQYDKVERNGYTLRKYMTQADIEFLKYFICIVSGKSLFKEYFQYYYITKKETAVFINCNVDYVKTPQHALLYSFLYSALEPQNRKHDIKKFFDLFNNSKKILGLYADSKFSFYKNQYVKDIINFICKYEFEEAKDGFTEYMDFLNSKINDNFSLKNRTLNSIKCLSNEWHLDVIKSSTPNKNSSWNPLFADEDWTEKRDNVSWLCFELTKAKELISEGRKQKHCVGSYIDKCLCGNCHIFSMVSDKGSSITLEVGVYGNGGKTLIQARKKLNANPNKEEQAIIKKWCIEKKISFKNLFN